MLNYERARFRKLLEEDGTIAVHTTTVEDIDAPGDFLSIDTADVELSAPDVASVHPASEEETRARGAVARGRTRLLVQIILLPTSVCLWRSRG